MAQSYLLPKVVQQWPAIFLLLRGLAVQRLSRHASEMRACLWFCQIDLVNLASEV
jgi:hypothetical protein